MFSECRQAGESGLKNLTLPCGTLFFMYGVLARYKHKIAVKLDAVKINVTDWQPRCQERCFLFNTKRPFDRLHSIGFATRTI